MRWRGKRESDNVEDFRGRSGGSRIAIGGGIGTILIVIIGLLMGKSPMNIIGDVMDNNTQSQTYEQTAPVNPENDSTAQMVKVVLASTEDVWNAIFNQAGARYQAPRLRMFTGTTETACGPGQQAMGPFYCPGDQKVYIDLSFCEELRTRFRAPGNFAVAYVIAHEVGHHIQHLMGTSGKVQQLRGQVSEAEYNRYSVALELQADFYAGVWAYHAQHQDQYFLEAGDLEAALRAAHAIGDDKLQKEAQGYIVPDAFTHGTSEQRMFWFRKGFETGDLNQGNTFRALGLTN